MPTSASAALATLQELKYDFSPSAATRKVELFDDLATRRMASGDSVLALHEAACFARAFPENRAVLDAAERLALAFGDRDDVARFRTALTDTGIAGTTLHFRFYWLTAIWLHRNGWSNQLTIDWDEFESHENLSELWHLLLPFSETLAFDNCGLETKDWIDRLKANFETDAEFVIRRFEALDVPIQLREKLYEDLDIPMTLAPGPTTPARGRERCPGQPIVFRDDPPPAGRPDLPRAIAETTIAVRNVAPREGRKLIDLANSCMVPRHRDLLIFLYADPKDVRMIDCGDGLQFACYGAVPERRMMLESVYGFLTLMNGVPIGYVLCSALFESSEIAYNVFETFRGRGAAHIYAKVLAMVRRLFGANSFAVDPYQLGHENEEGQRSGAFWFYYKLGFRPHDPGVRRLVREELARMKRNPRHRTPPARLNELAAAYMFLQLDGERDDVIGSIDLGNIGLRISQYLGARFGAEREQGLDLCEDEAAKILGIRSLRHFSRGERLCWRRWSPLVLILPGIRRWTDLQKRELARVIRAKGGPAESRFVELSNSHARLRTALCELADHEPEPATDAG